MSSRLVNNEELQPEVDQFDKAQQEALEEVDECQNEIDSLNEKASEAILKIEQGFNKLRKPLYERRNRIVQKLDNFWITAFVNHPLLTGILDEEEEDCLHSLIKLEVEDFEDIKFGYKIKFFFAPNEYFENDVLTKEIHLGSPVPRSEVTQIRWKEGKDLIKRIKERREKVQKPKKSKAEGKTFFTWYQDTRDPINDEIAEAIKDDLWPNALQYYLSPDVDVVLETNGIEEEAGPGEGASDEGDDNHDYQVTANDEEKEDDSQGQGAPPPSKRPRVEEEK